MKLQACLVFTLVAATLVAATSVRQAAAADPAAPTDHPNTEAVDTTRTILPMPSTTILQMPSYETTCGEQKHLRCEEHFRASVDSAKICCRFEGECGDTGMPRCGHATCCTDHSGDSTDITKSKELTCTCAGAVVNGKCYKTVQEAMDVDGSENTVYIGGTKTIVEPIYFTNRVITVAGVTCDGTRAKIVADFDSKTEAAFEASRWDQKMIFSDLDITGVEGKSSAGIHGRGNEEDAGHQMVDLTLLNVHIYDMWCQRTGCGIFLGGAKKLYTDDDCIFRNLTLQSSDHNLYAGGAAVGVVYLPRGNNITLRGTFKDNSASYEGGSAHSSGGAVYLDFVAGEVLLNGKFENNQANQGGAVNIQGNFGNITFDGLYKSNIAIDGGFGARAGAVRVQSLRSTSFTRMNGDFIGNIAQGRGGVLATNSHQSNSQLIFDGHYHANVAAERGGVWNFWSASTVYRGDTVLYKTAQFTNNAAHGDADASSIYYVSGNPSAKPALPKNPSAKFAEIEWNGTTTAVYGNTTGVVLYTEQDVNNDNKWFKLTESIRYAGHLPSITFDEYVYGKKKEIATQRYVEKVEVLEERYATKFDAALSKAEIDEARVLQRFTNATIRINERFDNADKDWQVKLENKTAKINDRFDSAAAKANLRFEEASAKANDRYTTKLSTANERYASYDPTAENNKYSEANDKIAQRYQDAIGRAELERNNATERAEQRFAADMEKINATYIANELEVLTRYNEKSQDATDKFLEEKKVALARADPTEALSSAETKKAKNIQAADDEKTDDLERFNNVRQEKSEEAEAKKKTALAAVEERYRAAEEAASVKRDEDLVAVEVDLQSRQSVAEDKRDAAIREATQRQTDDLAAAESKREESLAAAESKRDFDFEGLDTYDDDMAAAKQKFEDDLAIAEQKKIDDLAVVDDKNQTRIDAVQAVKDFQQAQANLIRDNIMAGKPSMEGVDKIVLGAERTDDDDSESEN
ncbi:hypothetical protein SARC_02187 [Sphaeroforma arctica JP610]|uniref:Right handed beta helix domain-containing protein n=1 Tax=Sphaeroforma arctica JP610 TaxID=667725 RepID=A0A0L0G9N3_9EUKA|nr:hypothetical protein SARC_02187 [Sphaeroforma arctica JP610]KNC85614.1 hypothetical protein SARC_02187 [Sphaeroforma arctica JP610]|eukprot:XP_014159516.1 hypothetical protein SARC_02187 [Sphaeroforma arctica JP610]